MKASELIRELEAQQHDEDDEPRYDPEIRLSYVYDDTNGKRHWETWDILCVDVDEDGVFIHLEGQGG